MIFFSRRDILKISSLFFLTQNKKILSEGCRQNIKDQTDPIFFDENKFIYSVDGPFNISSGRLTIFFKNPENISKIVLTTISNEMIESKINYKKSNYFIFYNIVSDTQYQLIINDGDKIYRYVFEKKFTKFNFSKNLSFLSSGEFIENFFNPSKNFMTSCYERKCYGDFFPLITLIDGSLLKVTFKKNFYGKFFITDPVGTVLIQKEECKKISEKELEIEVDSYIPYSCPYLRCFISMDYGGYIHAILTVLV